MRDDGERLRDILEAIEKVQKYAARGRESFERDELVRTWIVHHIQVVGEAAAKVSLEQQQRHPEIPWVRIIVMRNVLVHEYFGIDPEEVWSVVERDLPDLKRKIEAILKEIGDES